MANKFCFYEFVEVGCIAPGEEMKSINYLFIRRTFRKEPISYVITLAALLSYLTLPAMEESFVKGTCQAMCPVKEAKLRQKEKLLHKFEMKRGTENNKVPEYDPERIVKCFNRSAAGVKTTSPDNLRPFPVLMKTINFLYQEIFPFHKERPVYVYNFMFDRFRAIRQDAVVQNLSPAETIEILEPIVRFLIYFGYILINAEKGEFDVHINNTHLQECMKRLLVCYDECSEEMHKNQWQIESAFLLFNLGNIKSLTRGVRQLEISTSETYQDCLNLSLQWYNRNYHRVFKLILKLPLLLLFVISAYVPEIRMYSLKAMSHGFSCSNSAYPVRNLCYQLLYENDSEAKKDCDRFNIKVSQGIINFSKKNFDYSVQCEPGVRLGWVDNEVANCDNLTQLLCSGFEI